jgi:hypothetical protein
LIFIYAQPAGLTLLKHIFDKASNNTYKEADKFTDIQADISTDVRTSASPLNLLNHVISETIAENLEEWFQSKKYISNRMILEYLFAAHKKEESKNALKIAGENLYEVISGYSLYRTPVLNEKINVLSNDFVRDQLYEIQNYTNFQQNDQSSEEDIFNTIESIRNNSDMEMMNRFFKSHYYELMPKIKTSSKLLTEVVIPEKISKTKNQDISTTLASNAISLCALYCLSKITKTVKSIISGKKTEIPNRISPNMLIERLNSLKSSEHTEADKLKNKNIKNLIKKLEKFNT